MEYVDGLEALRSSDGKKFNTLKNMRLSDRMISPFDWSAFGRSFDGATGGYQNENLNFTSAFLLPTQGGWEKDFGETIEDIEIQAATLTLAKEFGIPNTESAFFYYRYSDNRTVVQRVDNVQSFSATGVDLDIQMAGGHLLGLYPAGSVQADLLLWGGLQWGDWYEFNHRAYAFSAEAGFQFTEVLFKPWVRLGYSSGSGDTDSGDKDHETFFQMAPGTRKYQLLPFYDFMNSRDVFTQLILKFRENLLFRMEWHQISLSESEDRWYMGSGPTQESGSVFGYIGRPSGGDRNLASEWDMIADYEINKFFKMIFCYSRVFGKEVIENLYTENDKAQFFSAEVQFKY